MKIPETKKFGKILCEALLIFKNILLKPSRTYFHIFKKGSLNPQAVRIRVKCHLRSCQHLEEIFRNSKLKLLPSKI
jgi:hypothetical protein